MKIVANSWKQAERHKVICLQNKNFDNIGTLNNKLINSNYLSKIVTETFRHERSRKSFKSLLSKQEV